ncbi:MAG: LPS export ABC transporter permease LptF [Desulfurivibrionaceae bacterium]|nr:LPS export ABC transporter permease LptF [Desulfobulbales bacterium]MDT8334408.1 LPS export ABC transporter permease LptF [Desulfurivibrionaceae bacterium]
MPLLLYAYLAAEILGPFFAALVIINAILFLGKLSSLLDVIFGFGIGMADFGRISAYLLPNLMLFSIPMAATLGVIIAFTRMTGDNEVLALKASGISLYRMLVPVVLVACFTTGLTVLTSTLLIPKSNVALKQTFFQLAREKIEKGVQAREFSDHIKDVVVYVERIDKGTGQWRGVFISDHRDRDNPMTIIAKSGSLEADLDDMTVRLVLRNGSIHREGAAASQTIRFGSYNLKLPVTSAAPLQGWDKKDMSPGELLAKAGELKVEAAQAPRRRAKLTQIAAGLLIEFHKRFALSVGCLILTILALPLALQSKPGRSKAGLPLGLFFFFIYYILLSFAKSVAESSTMPVWPIMWAPNLVFAVLTMLIVRTAARENSVGIFDRLIDYLTELGKSLIRVKNKLIR